MVFTLPIIYLVDKYLTVKKTRWFSLHAIINLFISICSCSSVLYVFKNPKNLLMNNYEQNINIFSINNYWSADFVISLHIYHTLFFNITKNDLMHHLIFVPFTLMNISNNIKNIIAFFICGFPGMLSYIALILKKLNYIELLTEKKIALFQNICLRVPGAFFIIFSLFYSNINIVDLSSLFKILLISLMMVFNSLYYLQLTINSYYLKRYKTKLK